MKLSQVSHALSVAARAHRPVMLHGQPGIGKSQIVTQTAQAAASAMGLKGVAEYGHRYADGTSPSEFFGLHDVRLSQCEPVDIRGLPVPDVAGGTTRWLVPDWFPHTGRVDLPERGILFLDEVTNAPPSVQAAAYQITLDRRCGDHVLKRGWSIVLAGNRLSDSGATFKMPLPLCNRLMHLYPEVNLDEWCSWAIDRALPVELIAFLRLRPDLLNTFEDHVKHKREGVAFCTPRSWEIVADVFSVCKDDDLLLPLLNGTIGEGPAAEFFGFRKVWGSMPSIDNILLNPDNAPVPEDAATLFAVSAALANRATLDNVDNVVAYMNRMRPEFSVLTCKDMMRRDQKLAATPAFVVWANKHAKLLGSAK